MDQSIKISVESVLAECRQAIEPLWPIWKAFSGHPEPDDGPISADCCVPTSFVIRTVLEVTHPEFRWAVTGGRPTKRTPNGGFCGPGGLPRPHLWVEGRKPGMAVVADITADQFGGPEILCCPLPDPRYQANATRKLLQSYERHEAGTIAFWLETIASYEDRPAACGATL